MSRYSCVFAFAVLAIMPLPAQLAPPNSTGVAIGHVHLYVSDVEMHKRFWTAIGGKEIHSGRLSIIEFPGVYIIVRKEPTVGGNEGTVLNHFGFYVKDLSSLLPKL